MNTHHPTACQQASSQAASRLGTLRYGVQTGGTKAGQVGQWAGRKGIRGRRDQGAPQEARLWGASADTVDTVSFSLCRTSIRQCYKTTQASQALLPGCPSRSLLPTQARPRHCSGCWEDALCVAAPFPSTHTVCSSTHSSSRHLWGGGHLCPPPPSSLSLRRFPVPVPGGIPPHMLCQVS